MKRCFAISLLLILSTGLLLVLPAHASSPDKRIEIVKTALLRWLSMEYYWLDGWIGPGMSAPLRVKFVGNKFQVLTDVVVSKDTRVFGYYWGRFKNGNAAIIMREGFTTSFDGSDQERVFEKRRKVFDSGRVFQNHLLMPADLTPRYDPPSKQKERMLEAIVNTMRQAGGGSTGSELLIGDFNVDYPYTYVMVQPSEDIYRLALHDFQAYDSREYEKGGYPWGTVDDEDALKNLRAKIRLHHIVRKVR